MSKATKLRNKALKGEANTILSKLIEDKMKAKPQKIESIAPTTLSNGQKGVSITFDIFK
jgi:hypothetical protein